MSQGINKQFWFADAPANLALIKYMGKQSSEDNSPINASFSYTLNHLRSFVEIQVHSNQEDSWEPLVLPNFRPYRLSELEKHRFLAHFQRIKAEFSYKGCFIIRSCNNFPASTGIASSASSFSALTLCAIQAFSELTYQPLWAVDKMAAISRLASGSSCRSFFEPWALWEVDGSVQSLNLPHQNLLHTVVLISCTPKAISSSEAHRRVRYSPLFEQRPARAAYRLQVLIDALKTGSWCEIFNVCWEEFQDMHRMFETSEQPFSYQTEKTNKILALVQAFWAEQGDGPIVTMDAGTNIHLLFRPDQLAIAKNWTKNILGPYTVLSSL